MPFIDPPGGDSANVRHYFRTRASRIRDHLSTNISGFHSYVFLVYRRRFFIIIILRADAPTQTRNEWDEEVAEALSSYRNHRSTSSGQTLYDLAAYVIAQRRSGSHRLRWLSVPGGFSTSAMDHANG